MNNETTQPQAVDVSGEKDVLREEKFPGAKEVISRSSIPQLSGSEGEGSGSVGRGDGWEWRSDRDNCFMLYVGGELFGMVRDWPEPWQKDPSEKWSYTILGEYRNHYFPTEAEAKSALLAASPAQAPGTQPAESEDEPQDVH